MMKLANLERTIQTRLRIARQPGFKDQILSGIKGMSLFGYHESSRFQSAIYRGMRAQVAKVPGGSDEALS